MIFLSDRVICLSVERKCSCLGDSGIQKIFFFLTRSFLCLLRGYVRVSGVSRAMCLYLPSSREEI